MDVIVRTVFMLKHIETLLPGVMDVTWSQTTHNRQTVIATYRLNQPKGDTVKQVYVAFYLLIGTYCKIHPVEHFILYTAY